jgi:hypothetical protein
MHSKYYIKNKPENAFKIQKKGLKIVLRYVKKKNRKIFVSVNEYIIQS